MNPDTTLRITSNTTWFSIFTSASTLICCAIPALLVAIGAGAVLASAASAVPQFVWLSENKLSVFLLAGVMLAVSGWLQWRARSLPCPTDAQLALQCASARKTSLWIYAFSVIIFVIGVFFAFVAPLIID